MATIPTTKAGAAFDPDAFLAEPSPAPAPAQPFDPDAFLADGAAATREVTAQDVTDVGTSRHSFAAGVVRESDALLAAKDQAQRQQFEQTWADTTGPAPASPQMQADDAPLIYPEETRAVFARNAAGQRQQAADDAAQLKKLFELAPNVDGANEVQVQQLARALGVSSDTVRENLPAWKSFGEVAGWNADEWTKRNPELTQVMLGDSRVGLSRVVWEERNPLEKLVAAIKRPFNVRFSNGTDELNNIAPDQRAAELAASDKRAEAQYQADIAPRAVEQTDNQQAKDIREGGSLAGVALTALTGGVLGDPRIAGIAAQRAIEAHHGMQSSRLWSKYALQRAAEQLGQPIGDSADTLARAQEEAALAQPLYLGDNEGGVAGFAGDVGGGVVATAEQQAIRFGAAGAGGAVGAAVGAAGGAGLALLGGQPELAGIAAEEGASAGFNVGARIGYQGGNVASMADMAITEGGDLAKTLYEQKDETGATLDPLTILGASLAAGLINMQLEGLGSEASAGKLTKELFAGRIQRDPTLREALKRLALERLKDTGTEMWTEPMQDAVREVFAFAGRGVQAGSFDDVKWQYSESDALEASWGAFAGSLPFGGGQTAVELATTRINNDAKKSANEAVPDILNMAGTQTAQAHPEAFAQVVADATSSSGHPPVSSMFLDADEGLRLMQQGGTEAQEVIERTLGAGAGVRLTEAAAMGGRLEIPMSQVPGFINTELGKQLRDSLAADPTSLSPRQQKTQGAEVEKAAQALFDNAVKEMQTGANLEASLRAAEDGAAAALEEKLGKRQARQVARNQTVITRAFMESQAEKAGKTVTELFSAAPVTFRAGDNQQFSEKLNQNEVPTREQVDAELSADLAKRQAATPDAVAEEFFRDPRTGLLGPRGFKLASRDSNLIGSIAIEGMKFVNDTWGYSAGDKLYDAAARALASVPALNNGTLAKVGGDFAVSGLTQEQLDAALAEASKSPDLNGLRLTGAVAPNLYDANKAHIVMRAGMEQRGERALRAQRPFSFSANFEPSMLGSGKATAPIASEMAARFNALTPEQKLGTWYREPSGMLTKEGIDAYLKLHPKKWAVSADVNLIKVLNDPELLTWAGTDDLLDQFGRMVMAAGGAEFLGAHISGDEYTFHTDNPEAVMEFLHELELKSRKALVEVTTDTGEKKYMPGIVFGYGIGNDLDSANADLHIHKQQLAVLGERSSDTEEARRIARAKLAFGAQLAAERKARDRAQGAEGQRSADRQREADSSGRTSEAVAGNEGGTSGEGSGRLSQEVTRLYAAARLDQRETSTLKSVEDWAEQQGLSVVVTESDEALTLSKLVVPEARRGTGLGTEFLRRLIAHAEAVGKPIFTSPSSDFGSTAAKVRAFNARVGFIDNKAKSRLFMSRETMVYVPRNLNVKLYAREGGTTKGYTSAHPEMEAMAGAVAAFLNKNADASTVIHEGAHGFLGWMQHLAAQPDATEATKQQWADATKALTGRTLTGEEFNALPEAERVAAHEKFARSFEQYVKEGKAPSAGLKRAFAAFSRWLLRIYVAVKTVPESQLNDDMRAVFDAMLTTQTEVKRARQQQGPRVAATQQQREEEDDDYTEGSYAQQLRAVKDALRRNEAWWKAEVKARAVEFGDAWEKLPAVQARKHAEAAGVVFDRAAVDAVLKGRKLAGIRTVKEGGLKPDVLASLFNFSTGEEMLKAIAALPAEKETWVQAQVDQHMREKFPGVLDNIEEFRRQLAGDLHAATVKRVMSETKVTPAQRAAAQKAAELLVQRRTVRELRPAQALRAQRMAAEKKAAAMAKGDARAAALAAQQELLNLFMHQQLLEAEQGVAKFEQLASEMKKPAAVARLGKASPTYRDAAAFLLGELGLGAETDFSDSTLTQAVAQANGDAVLIGDPEWLDPVKQALKSGALVTRNRRGEEVRDFRGLNVAELAAVHDALLTLRAAARQRTTAQVGGKRVEISDFREQLKREARENKEAVRPVGEKSLAAVVQRAAHRITGPLLKIETIVDWLGGSLVQPGKELNSAWHSLFVMLESARQHEVDLQRRYAEPVMKAFRDMPAEVLNSFGQRIDGKALFPTHRLVLGLNADGSQKLTDEALTAPSTVGELFMMLLNAGNEENLQRLCDGRSITPEQVFNAFNKYMTPAHIEAANAIGEAFETMWPEIQAMEERISGVKPKGVEKRPLQLQAGVLRGHYFPAIYDPRVAGPGVNQSEQAQADAVASLFSPTIGRPQTTHGHRKARAEMVYGAINLDAGSIGSHLAQHAHDLAFYERVGDVWRILDDRELRGVMNARLGHRRTEQVYQWVKDAARVADLSGSVAGGGFWSFLRKMQANQTIALLGYSVPNAVEDAMAPLAVAFDRDLQPSYYAKGLLDFFTPGSGGWDALAAKSKGLSTAEASVQAELARELKRIDQSSSGLVRAASRARDVLQAHAFAMNEVVFRYTAGPAWLGRYQQALADGADEAQAQEAANALVRRNWPSFHAVNASGVSRDVRLKPFVPFYGYFSTVVNKRLDEVQRVLEAPGAVDKARAAGRLLGFSLVASLLAPAVKEMVRTRGAGPDEPPEEWALWTLLQGELGMLPFGGDFANTVHQVFGKGLRPSPRASAVSQSLIQPVVALKALTGDDPAEWKSIKAYLDAFGLWFGLPTSTAKFGVETAADVSNAGTP